MRRMTYFVMALALVLGFTQCKKEQPVPQNENQAEGVRITLNLGDDNSKVVVTPGFYNSETGETYAKVEFEAGDVIYVGNNGAYCGYLEYNGSTNKFEGEVTPTSEDDYLHFYFMGNKGAKSQPSSVSITDQTSKYPVISYAHSTVKYASGTTSYSAKLQNYCAIVKFTTTNIDADITITGMNNTVAVDFDANNAANGTGIGNNPYTPSKTDDGNITLHKVSNTERWAILLQQDEVTNATASATGYTFKTFTVPAIENNQYLTNSGAGYSITVESVTWNENDLAEIDLSSYGSYSKSDDISVWVDGGNTYWDAQAVLVSGGEVYFRSSIGNITSIVMTGFSVGEGNLLDGWTVSGTTLIWSGEPNTTVPLAVGESYWDDDLEDWVDVYTYIEIEENAQIVFTVQP